MNNDNTLKFAYSRTKFSGWLRYCVSIFKKQDLLLIFIIFICA